MITQEVCNSFKVESWNGVHQPEDTYMIALYDAAAALSKQTTAYTPTNEVSGSGYDAGGQALSGRSVFLDGDVAVLDFDDPVWPVATITARGALIYNASKGNAAIAVLKFASDVSSTNGPFVVTLPAPTASKALLRLF